MEEDGRSGSGSGSGQGKAAAVAAAADDDGIGRFAVASCAVCSLVTKTIYFLVTNHKQCD